MLQEEGIALLGTDNINYTINTTILLYCCRYSLLLCKKPVNVNINNTLSCNHSVMKYHQLCIILYSIFIYCYRRKSTIGVADLLATMNRHCQPRLTLPVSSKVILLLLRSNCINYTIWYLSNSQSSVNSSLTSLYCKKINC